MSHNSFLHLHSIYGVKKDVFGNVFFLPVKSSTFKDESEATILTRVCGNCLVCGNLTDDKEMFITPGSISKGITAVCVFKGRTHFGVAVRGEKHPLVLLYEIGDNRIQKTLPVPDVGSKEVICLDRSKDQRLLIAQGGAPEYRLCVWLFNDALKLKKCVGALDVLGQDHDSKVYQSSVSSNGRYICVTGEKLFRLYKVEEGRVTPVRKELGLSSTDNQSLLSHIWLWDREDRLVVANATGHLFLVEDHEIKMVLNCSPANQLSINRLIAYDRGAFVAGGENGYVTLFERTEDQDMFKKHKTIKLPNEDNLYNSDELTVMNMDYDNATGTLVCSTRAGQVYLVQVSGGSHLRESDVVCVSPFHFRRLTGLAAAVKKPYIVTSSLDRTVRVFNHQTRTMEIVHRFAMEAHSVAVHPTGYFVVVGFTDKLRFFKLLDREFREEMSYPIRNCREVQFSHGGQFFAAAHGTSIHVYDSYTYQHLYSLRNAHTGKVSALAWGTQDTSITSVDLNGNVVAFNLRNETKIWDHLLKDCSLSAVASNSKSTYVSGSDSRLHVFVEQVPLSEFRTDRYPFTALTTSDRGRLLMAGKEDGSLIVFSQTNVDEAREQLYFQSGRVTRMVTSNRDELLCAISEDGSMAVFEVRERERNFGGDTAISEGPTRVVEEWDEEILISKGDLQAMKENIKELELKCQDLMSDNEYNLIKRQLEYNNVVKQQAETFEKDTHRRLKRVNELEEEIRQKKRKYNVRRREKMDAHKKEITDLEYQYNERIHDTLNKLKDVEEKKTKELDALAGEANREEGLRLKHLEGLSDEELKETSNVNSQIQSRRGEQRQNQSEYERQLSDLKRRNNRYVEKIEDQYERKLMKARLENERLVRENEEKTSHEQRYDERIDELRNNIREKQNLLRKKKEEYEQKDRETDSIQKENQEREDTISEKERRIHELNKQNKELKKFRFVLNYKIETLQDEINPNNETIDTMRQEMKKYDRELSKYSKERKKYQFSIRDLERKINGNETELKSIQNKHARMKDFRTQLKKDIFDVYREIANHKTFKKKLVSLFDQYSSKKAISARSKGKGGGHHSRDSRRVTYLEKTVENLKLKLVKAKKVTNKETMRIMHENVMLLNEINQLRRELRFLARRLFERMNPTRVDTDETGTHGPNINLQQSIRILEMQKIEIQTLRNKINQLEIEKST